MEVDSVETTNTILHSVTVIVQWVLYDYSNSGNKTSTCWPHLLL